VIRTFISVFPLQFVGFKFKGFRAFTNDTPKIISKKKSKKKSNVNPETGSDYLNFRLRGKRLFLTYPRCGLSLETCKSFLFLLLLNNEITEFIFVREKHAPEDAVPNTNTIICYNNEKLLNIAAKSAGKNFPKRDIIYQTHK
jgi:hypothetical protein